MILKDGRNRMSNENKVALDSRIDQIESAYEFMLAYAAQGHESTAGTAEGQEITDYLMGIDQALSGLGETIRAAAEEKNADSHLTYLSFIEALESDALRTQGAVRLVLAQGSISSQLIDNLNASIHLRALLTDLFVFDEALK